MGSKNSNNFVPSFGTDQTAPHGLKSTQPSTKHLNKKPVPTQSPRCVEPLYFLARRNLTVRSVRILERSHSLSLQKNQKPSLCNSFPLLHVLAPFLLKKMTTIPYFVLFLIKLSKNVIHVLKILDFDTWHYLGHPFPSSLYSCNMCHMCTCYR